MVKAKRKTETNHKKTEKEDERSVDPKVQSARRLYRSAHNKMIAGVCAGLGDYFNIDPTVVRLIFVVATIFGGYGIPVYIVLWIILPEGESSNIGAEDTVKKNVAEIRTKAEDFASGLRSDTKEGRTRLVIGAMLIGLGIIFLYDNFGFFRADYFWPLILVVIGLLLLRR